MKARWKKRKEYHSGTITKANNNKYDIQYDDGDIEKKVSWSYIEKLIQDDIEGLSDDAEGSKGIPEADENRSNSEESSDMADSFESELEQRPSKKRRS